MMKMRTINFDYVQSSWPSLLGTVVFATGLILVTFAWYSYQVQAKNNQVLAGNISQLQAKSKKNETQVSHVNEKPSEEVMLAMQDAHHTAEFLALPWGDIFDALEASSTTDIALLAIEPDSKKREVKITAEAKDSAVLFDYLKRLDKTSQLSGVYLVHHEITEDANKQHPIRFVVAAEWKDKS